MAFQGECTQPCFCPISCFNIKDHCMHVGNIAGHIKSKTINHLFGSAGKDSTIISQGSSHCNICVVSSYGDFNIFTVFDPNVFNFQCQKDRLAIIHLAIVISCSVIDSYSILYDVRPAGRNNIYLCMIAVIICFCYHNIHYGGWNLWEDSDAYLASGCCSCANDLSIYAESNKSAIISRNIEQG